MSTDPARLPGARVDTRRPVDFEFDGRRLRAFAGDTLASALLANGVTVVGRSFKFHRPRGVMGAGKEECNALVQLDTGGRTQPNVRASLVTVWPGLVARSQNAWPNAQWDVFAVLGLVKPLLPASFYYKTFMWPSWHFWEGMVRRLAGLGRAPESADPYRYVKQNVHVDVLVVGAGRTGIQAALEAAADPFSRVLLVDEQCEPGGRLLASRVEQDSEWLVDALAKLERASNVTLLTRTTVNGYHENNVLSAVEQIGMAGVVPVEGAVSERLWRIFAGRVVLATGAIERPMVFPNNDRPGVMLASAVAEYTCRFGLVLGERIVFYVNNDSAWRAALSISAAGVGVSAIVDIRESVDEGLLRHAREAGIGTYLGCAIVDTRGRKRIRELRFRGLLPGGRALAGPEQRLACDLLAVSGGWNPTLHLFSQSGGRLEYRDSDACFVPGERTQEVSVVGSASGDFQWGGALRPQWLTPDTPSASQWIDLQYDVTAADIQLARRENFVSVEHVKRYTTNGMSVDQGKTSNVNALGVLSMAANCAPGEVGTTRFRPPYHPATIGAYAGIETGPLYHPYQRLPAHDEHVVAGAVFEDYGPWKRPAYYPRDNEDEEAAIAREAMAVRKAVGLLDYSSLGKIEVMGPDAREFLNRVYVNNLRSLSIGAARYCLMLNESGVVFDDGIVVCLAADHFLLHTTSAGAATVHEHLEEWLQCEWPELQLLVSNVTTQWATLMLSGPLARTVLSKLDPSIDLAPKAFTHMKFRAGHILGHSCRILRASYTGELGYEISVPASAGVELWRALLAAGASHGILPFGVETLMLLRTEKGYLHLGQDTDGTTMPQDLGWADLIGRKADDFIGRRSTSLPVGLDSDRLQFTGIEPLDPLDRLASGSHVLAADGKKSAGYVTASYFSPTLGRNVALGIVAGAQHRLGEEVQVFHAGNCIAARLVDLASYDPDGEALRE